MSEDAGRPDVTDPEGDLGGDAEAPTGVGQGGEHSDPEEPEQGDLEVG